MASVVISGDSSGTITLSAPSVAGTNTATLPAQTGTVGMIAQGTAVATTSGTSVTFTGIPSWAKSITVMFNGVSTNGSSPIIIQIGSGSVSTSGYISNGSAIQGANVGAGSYTTGFGIADANLAVFIGYGVASINLISSNLYTFMSVMAQNGAANPRTIHGGGVSPTLGGALDRVIITTVNGTDTFDAGSVNILYQG